MPGVRFLAPRVAVRVATWYDSLDNSNKLCQPRGARLALWLRRSARSLARRPPGETPDPKRARYFSTSFMRRALSSYARRAAPGAGALRLRAAIAAPEIVVLPGAFDCFSARLVESEGFEACFITGQGLSGSLIGRPDYGFLTASESLGAAARICASVDIPVIADLDTGFGGPLNVFRTIEQAAADGVAGFILEDQEWPKKCGHMEDRGSPKKVIDSTEHAAKIAAAAEARGDSEMVIIARTDARAFIGAHVAAFSLAHTKSLIRAHSAPDAFTDARTFIGAHVAAVARAHASALLRANGAAVTRTNARTFIRANSIAIADTHS